MALFNDPGRCPTCGERVTPFAAGCALCGTELDPRRWQPRPSLLRRLRGERRSPPASGG
jgi:predicted amidophosphoribosyltransferase